MKVYTEDTKIPIKMWLDDLEEGALDQAKNLANLPFAFKHIAMMPDAHQGYGMPIGTVLATKDVIIPNGVGVDIGCGMAYVSTNIHKDILTKDDYQNLVGNIMRNIPVGFNHHQKRQTSEVLDVATYRVEALNYGQELIPEIDKAYTSIGTLGGGNHFIEIQEDEDGFLSIMLHSGSRNLGLQIAKYFNNIAKDLNTKWFSEVKSDIDLAFLPANSDEGKAYIEWMNLALDFARESRSQMLHVIISILEKKVPSAVFTMPLNVHHNYVAIENHFGQNVWVHRKGAIKVREGQLGIIPGAMGSSSYIVSGLGNPMSFDSCSHGAGRRMGRKESTRQFSVEATMLDLKNKGVILGKNGKGNVTEECIWAYKDVDTVIENQLDLITPIKKLKTVVVVKG